MGQFGINFEMLSCGNILHLTYGICYQNTANSTLAQSKDGELEESYEALRTKATKFRKRPSLGFINREQVQEPQRLQQQSTLDDGEIDLVVAQQEEPHLINVTRQQEEDQL